MISNTHAADSGDSPLRLALFPRDRRAALSLTFDDGFRTEVHDALATLDPLGLNGTFFLIPFAMIEGDKAGTQFIGWEEVIAMQLNGHEIGTHGLTKDKLHEVDDEKRRYLVNESWRILKERTGIAPVSYAVPGGSDWRDSRVQATIEEHHRFLRKETLGYGNLPDLPWPEATIRGRIMDATKTGDWLVACIHSIVGGYRPFDGKDVFRAHCEWLKSLDPILWVAPMGDVGRYIAARDQAVLEVLEQQKRLVRFRLLSRVAEAEENAAPLTVVVAAQYPRNPTAETGSLALPVFNSPCALLVDVPMNGLVVTVRWE